MRDDCPVTRNIIDRQEWVLRIAEARGQSAALLSAATGIPKETIASYRPKPSRPASLMSLAAFVKLAKVLDGDLASLLIEDSGKRLAALDPEAANWDEIAAEGSMLTAEICTARADGRVDHQEKIRIRERGRSFIAKLQGAVEGD